MAKDFKQIKSEGDALLNEYKSHSLDVLTNETIKENRKRLIDDSEQFILENIQSAKNVIDFIWKYCWYDVISAFKVQRKKFTTSELDQLQQFIHEGIEYFQSLGLRQSHIQYRCLLYTGDLFRYEHKMLRSEDDVLDRATEYYKKAVELEPQNGSSYMKLACIYESKNPHIALDFLLRAIINKAASAVGSLQKLSIKNVPSAFSSVFKLTQSAFLDPISDFQSSLDSFKQHFDNYSTLPANVIIQNLYTACLLTIAIESLDDSCLGEEKLRLLVPYISQAFNIFIPILIGQLNKSEILKERRNCPSPFEETCDLDEAYASLGLEAEPTLYENVLFPVIPMILTLNEWVAYLSKWISSMKLSVGSRMMCQSVLYNFSELLNCFIAILGYRVHGDPIKWPKYCEWLSTNPLKLKKSQAFGILIDCLKKSIYSTDHPLDFDVKFKCNSSGKEVQMKETVVIEAFITPRCLIVSQESMLKHWMKIVFLIDSLKTTSLLIDNDTFEQSQQLEQCSLNIQRLQIEDKCLIYDTEALGSPIQIAKIINEECNNSRENLCLIMEDSEFAFERTSIPKGVEYCSAIELYTRYCNSNGLDSTKSFLPFVTCFH